MQPTRLLHLEVRPQTGGVVPIVVKRPVEEHVVVGPARLQDGLDACDVSVQRRQVPPDGVARIQLGRGVELPARPGGILRRIRRAVINHVIHAAHEQLVDLLLELVQRDREVLAEPRAGLGGRESSPGDMRGRGREFADEWIAAGVTQRSEDLCFRDVAGGVEVEQVAGRAVRLVAGETAARVRPGGERTEQMLEQHRVERLPVV